jgi:hypothetical protein
MHDPVRVTVGERERERELSPELGRERDSDRHALKQFGERRPVQQRHDQEQQLVVATEVEHRNDARIIERRRELGLTVQLDGERVGGMVDQFDRDLALEHTTHAPGDARRVPQTRLANCEGFVPPGWRLAAAFPSRPCR